MEQRMKRRPSLRLTLQVVLAVFFRPLCFLELVNADVDHYNLAPAAWHRLFVRRVRLRHEA